MLPTEHKVCDCRRDIGHFPCDGGRIKRVWTSTCIASSATWKEQAKCQLCLTLVNILRTPMLSCYKYNLSLFVVSAVSLNQYRVFLFSYSSKTEFVNMAVIHILYGLKLILWLKNDWVSKSPSLRHCNCLAKIAFMPYAYLWWHILRRFNHNYVEP